MNDGKNALESALYLVSTPIGSARDITLRALDVLSSCDILVSEDTRTLRRLMDLHGIGLGGRPLLSYHDHSSALERDKVLSLLAQGKSVAYASEAGTPLIADPGYQLVKAARDAGHKVTPCPGATAAIAALSISGLATDRFFFVGFLPAAKAGRQKMLQTLRDIPATLIFYESPRRVHEMLEDSAACLGGERRAVLVREVTKRFEECVSGTVSELAGQFHEHPPKGECVVLIDRMGDHPVEQADVDTLLRQALQRHRVKDAATIVAEMTGLPKKEVYARALEMKDTS